MFTTMMIRIKPGVSKRPRYPYTVHEYLPDEQRIVEEDESSATVEIIATGQELLVDKPSASVYTLDEEPMEIGLWIASTDELPARVISLEEKVLYDLLEHATSHSEKPAPPAVLERLTTEARSAAPETALRMSRWLATRLKSDVIPVLLKSLQLIDRLAMQANLEWLTFVKKLCAPGLAKASAFSKLDPIHGDRPATMIRQGGERVQQGICTLSVETHTSS